MNPLRVQLGLILILKRKKITIVSNNGFEKMFNYRSYTKTPTLVVLQDTSFIDNEAKCVNNIGHTQILEEMTITGRRAANVEQPTSKIKREIGIRVTSISHSFLCRFLYILSEKTPLL